LGHTIVVPTALHFLAYACSFSYLLQGTLDLLILKALGPGELHGLGISRRIEQIAHGTFLVKPGSLFQPFKSHRGSGLALFLLGRIGK
jgi:hypothetical protein